GGGDARGTVHVYSDVALVGAGRLAGVYADANANRACRAQSRLRLRRRRERVGGPAECDEERVALRVHLDSVVTRKRRPEQTAMLGERIRVAIAQLLEQARRTGDVGEE